MKSKASAWLINKNVENLSDNAYSQYIFEVFPAAGNRRFNY